MDGKNKAYFQHLFFDGHVSLKISEMLCQKTKTACPACACV
jgi:hypothetical protein